MLQQLQHPVDADLTVNDVFRPVSRFFDRITRPEQLLTALPAAIRTLVDPVETGAVVLSLPQDVQSHAYDFPAEFFTERDWVIRRPAPDTDEIAAVAELLASARRPMIIAGGGVIYSDATAELEHLAAAIGAPVAETFGGKGAVQTAAWWQVGGIGLEGTPATNTLANEADVVLTVGSRLTDFATGSHSIFANPDVRFASINVNVHDADRLGATGIVGDAKRGLAALTEAITERDLQADPSWRDRVEERADAWAIERADALNPDQLFDKSAVPADSDVVTTTDAVLTQGQIIGVLQEHARPGDVIVAAAGGPPGDLQKVWDATGGPDLPPGVRFLLHGIRDPGRDGGPDGAPRPVGPDHRVPRRRHLPDGTHRAGHRGAGGPADHRGDPGEPRLPGDPPVADVPQRPRVRQRVPLPHPAAGTGRRRRGGEGGAPGR